LHYAGPIGDVGLMAETDLINKMKLNIEIPMQSLASFLEQHDCLLAHPEPIVACTAPFNISGKRTEKSDFIGLVMQVLNIEDRKTLSMNSTFSQIGVDSLVSVEMQQMIEREYGLTLTSSELRALTVSELDTKVMQHQKSEAAAVNDEKEK
jgi:fatty acid synthase